MRLSPDTLVFWQHGFFKLNDTLVTTWALMLFLCVGAWLVTRRLASDGPISRWQSFLEIIVSGISVQIKEIGIISPEKYLGFIGTLFLFVGTASLFTILPGYDPPTASLSTTVALALCVFVAVYVKYLIQRLDCLSRRRSR